MQVNSIAEYSKGKFLQYFRPSLSYHLSLRSLFSILSGRFTQVYCMVKLIGKKIFTILRPNILLSKPVNDHEKMRESNQQL